MDTALKQRLIGALVLIALAVIVLPMLLGGKQGGTGIESSEIELPVEPRELDFETRKFPVGAQPMPGKTSNNRDGRDGTETAGVPDRLPLPKVEIPADSKPASVDPEEGSVLQTAEGAPQVSLPTLEPAASEENAGELAEQQAEEMDALVSDIMAASSQELGLRYVVQVASFGHSSNAVQLSAQLRSAGFSVLLDNVSGEAGELSRVRVGPYATEDEALAAIRDIESRFSGVNPRIVDLQPEATASALVSEDPLMRWVVQVGTFSSAENAQKLVGRLKASGLSAYEESVRTDSAVMYRVRVGPFLDRAGALEAERRVASETGIDGVVMSSD